MGSLLHALREFGADPAALRNFDDDGPDLLPYATLLAARRGPGAVLDIVDAVYEWQNQPLLFLISADRLGGDDAQLSRVRRLLAMRGDAPYLGVVAPGRLDVFRIALDKQTPKQARVNVQVPRKEQAATLARLGNTRPQGAVKPGQWISHVVLKLLTSSLEELRRLPGIPLEDAISLVGRALFMRFLADRGLVSDDAASSFDRPDVASTTSHWLDTTFNGDLLPLSDGIFERLPPGAFRALGNILRRAPGGQLFLGWEERWANLDFAHIPVGVLSQAYEHHLRKFAPKKQHKEGGYYTPRPIADLMVKASFKALARGGTAANVRVLDPAAGAGVFLLTAFRELVAERWRCDRKRPDTAALRQILYHQITGFDIDEAALRFAALGLYLISIELDAEPKPLEKLRFTNLRGKVLHRLSDPQNEKEPGLGSLGPLVGDEHIGSYDLVIGNPPWASSTKLANWELVQKKVGHIARTRLGIGHAEPPLPNEVLDLPFVWRAMEWAKPEGQIAFALHARVLFQQGDGMPEARQAIFDALDVTSIVNGTELRQTKVWPEISAPFCLLFARNRCPGPGSGFRLISPRLESSLNDAGGMRIDALNGEIVTHHQLRDTPEILKILFRGTQTDLQIFERIRAQGHPTLHAFWRDTFGITKRGLLRGCGNGYQKLRPSSRARKKGDGLPGVAAKYLHHLREVTAESLSDGLIQLERLSKFREERIHDPRPLELFTKPLMILHQSPPAESKRIGVGVSTHDVLFSETFYGYSTAGFAQDLGLVQYLSLVLGSKLALWLALITSGKFGFERELIEKTTIDRIIVPDFRSLDRNLSARISSLFDGICSGGESAWVAVDSWVAQLYGLTQRDLQVISDTLDFNLPFAQNRREAQAAPTEATVRAFCEALEEELAPWGQRYGSRIVVAPMLATSASPWRGIHVYREDFPLDPATASDAWIGIMKAADEIAATEILMEDPPACLRIGRLAQARYWSHTQARLLARRIAWSYPGLFLGQLPASIPA